MLQISKAEKWTDEIRAWYFFVFNYWLNIGYILNVMFVNKKLFIRNISKSDWGQYLKEYYKICKISLLGSSRKSGIYDSSWKNNKNKQTNKHKDLICWVGLFFFSWVLFWFAVTDHITYNFVFQFPQLQLRRTLSVLHIHNCFTQWLHEIVFSDSSKNMHHFSTLPCNLKPDVVCPGL